MVFAAALILAQSPGWISGQILANNKPVADAVIWLEGPGEKLKPIRAKVIQRDRQFMPHISVVPVGSRVEFPNMDNIYHNVFAEHKAAKFDLGMYPKGQSRSVVMDKPGITSVLCSIHSEMSAYVMVVDAVEALKTDRNGRFKTKNLPSGTYTIQVWHKTLGEANVRRSISSGDAPVQISLKK